jgi:hypothetical protein
MVKNFNGEPIKVREQHETPGWYSVYKTDNSTLAIIAAHAER